MATRRKAVYRHKAVVRALLLSENVESDALRDLRRRAGLDELEPKFAWQGRVTSVQPRIRLTRSFDQASHTYLGFALRIEGRIGDEARAFWIGVGKEAQAKHGFEVGVVAGGECRRVAAPELETVEFYRVTGIEIHERPDAKVPAPGPPWHGVPPDLPTYRERGHRRLAAVTYEKKCSSCLWGCHLAVEMIVDHWNPSVRRYRTETFCYGPKSCPSYSAGPKRQVPGRKGMRYTEEDWVDEDATRHRADDE